MPTTQTVLQPMSFVTPLICDTTPVLDCEVTVGGAYFTTVDMPPLAPISVIIAPTGSLVFTVNGPGGFSYTQSVPLQDYYDCQCFFSTTLPTTGTVAGTYTCTASYSGDDNFLPANGTWVDLVQPASPTLTPNASPAEVVLGTTAPTLSFSADLENGFDPTGSIVFTLNGPGGFRTPRRTRSTIMALMMPAPRCLPRTRWRGRTRGRRATAGTPTTILFTASAWRPGRVREGMKNRTTRTTGPEIVRPWRETTWSSRATPRGKTTSMILLD